MKNVTISLIFSLASVSIFAADGQNITFEPMLVGTSAIEKVDRGSSFKAWCSKLLKESENLQTLITREGIVHPFFGLIKWESIVDYAFSSEKGVRKISLTIDGNGRPLTWEVIPSSHQDVQLYAHVKEICLCYLLNSKTKKGKPTVKNWGNMTKKRRAILATVHPENYILLYSSRLNCFIIQFLVQSRKRADEISKCSVDGFSLCREFGLSVDDYSGDPGGFKKVLHSALQSSIEA